MKTKNKILIAFVLQVLFMMALPLLVIEAFPNWAGIGLWFVSFFFINPLLAISLGVMAGTKMHRLWWIPLEIAVLFPLLFGVAIRDLVWDLYYYSAIYLAIGIIAMLCTHYGKQSTSGKKRADRKKTKT